MTAKEFDAIYERKIEEATMLLPNPEFHPNQFIEVVVIIQDLIPVMEELTPLPYIANNIIKFVFEKRRERNSGKLVWVRKIE